MRDALDDTRNHASRATDNGGGKVITTEFDPEKAARAKKNAELKALEKNGYQPGADLTSYPQNLQNAERKAGDKPGSSVPASGQ